MKRSEVLLQLSVLLHGVNDTQDVQEEVDDVQVEVDGGQDVFLGGELLHQQVGVIDDETAEDQGSGSGQDQLCAVTVEEEPHEARDDEDPQAGKQSCSQFGEVSLGLEGVGCEPSKHSTRQEQGLQHSGVFVEGQCCGHRNCLQQGKYEQQVEVDRMLVSVHGQGQQEDQRAQSRNQNHSRTGVNEVLDGLREHEEGGGGCGQDDLQAQEGVHLPQEIHPDLDAGCGDISAVVKVVLDGRAGVFFTAHLVSTGSPRLDRETGSCGLLQQGLCFRAALLLYAGTSDTAGCSFFFQSALLNKHKRTILRTG